MFGGCDHSLPPGPTSDMYILKMGTGKDFEWVKPDTTGTTPQPRWRHTATVFDQNKVLIFGGFHSSTNRFNDVHIFDTITRSWEQPINDQSDFTPRGNHTPAKGASMGTPPPRGAHSATNVDGVVYIFGGYGGMGYARRDFNDLYTFDTDDYSWHKVTAKGKVRGEYVVAYLRRLPCEPHFPSPRRS